MSLKEKLCKDPVKAIARIAIGLNVVKVILGADILISGRFGSDFNTLLQNSNQLHHQQKLLG